MSELKELKRLLVGEEADSLQRLRSRVEDRERRINDISEALPDVIGSGDERLIAALQRPVSDCIRTSIEREPKYFADILYPVMGPAIRAAISDAMRSLVRSINQTIESTMSVQGLKWRWESMRTGVPYGEIVLRNSFIYRVEQAFLVHRESGLLIDHAIAPEIAARDSDAVSGMLTAIQDFVRDSFADGEAGNLREIEVGSHQVWLAHGPHAMLAAVIRGIAPASLRGRLVSVLEDIHREFGSGIQHFDGDTTPLFGIQQNLESCLELEVRDTLEQSEVRRPSLVSTLVKVIAGVVLFSLLLWFLYSKIDARNKLDSARRIIDQTPGIVVTNMYWDDDQLRVVGLADPIADVDEDRLTQVGVDPQAIDYELEPYQSLESPIVVERTRSILDIPRDAQATLVDGVMQVSGPIDYGWYRELKADPVNIVGVRRFDLANASFVPGSQSRWYRDQLGASAAVSLSIDDGTLKLAGQAPQQWIESTERNFVPDEHVRAIDADALSPIELVSLRAREHAINTTRIELSAASDEGLRAVSGDIATAALQIEAYLAECKVLRRECAVVVLGNSVGVDADDTEALWMAEEVAIQLRSNGVPFAAVSADIGDVIRDTESTGTERVVEFRLLDDGG